jgi:ankyrin repeat protein
MLGRQQMVDMAKLVVAKGAQVDSIQLAAFIGDMAKVENFLDEGIDVNAKHNHGQTPLSLAVISGQKEMVGFLISRGADVNATGGLLGLRLLHSAVIYPDYEVAKLLIDNGADVNAKGPPLNVSPLLAPLVAAELIGMELLDLDDTFDRGFSDKEANLDMKDEQAAFAASIRRSWPDMRDVVELLLERGADVNDKDSFKGMTFLHHGAVLGLKDAAELSIAHGANVNASDSKGRTPLSLANEQGHAEIVELLRKHGAKEQ